MEIIPDKRKLVGLVEQAYEGKNPAGLFTLKPALARGIMRHKRRGNGQ
jgi:hypothetical protein